MAGSKAEREAPQSAHDPARVRTCKKSAGHVRGDCSGDIILLKLIGKRIGPLSLTLFVALILSIMCMIFFWSIQASRRNLCEYVVKDDERYAPGASAAQMQFEWLRCVNGRNRAANHHLYYLMTTNIFQRAGNAIAPMLAYRSLAFEHRSADTLPPKIIIVTALSLTAWGAFWNLALGQGFASVWERPALLTIPTLASFVYTARWVDRLLPYRALTSDWVLVALVQEVLRWVYSEAIASPILLQNALGIRVLLYRVFAHPLLCSIVLEIVKHILFKTATKRGKALFVLATDTIFIRGFFDRLLVDMSEKLGNIVLIQVVLSASRVASRVLVRDSETRLYRIFYGENTAAALTCTPQHNRDSVMIKQMETITEFVAIALVAVQTSTLNVRYDGSEGNLRPTTAAAAQTVLQLIVEIVQYMLDSTLHDRDYELGMSWLWKSHFILLFGFLLSLQVSFLNDTTKRLLCPFDQSEAREGAFAMKLCPPFSVGNLNTLEPSVAMLEKPVNNYNTSAAFEALLKTAVPKE